jgi:hypothetical protein
MSDSGSLVCISEWHSPALYVYDHRVVALESCQRRNGYGEFENLYCISVDPTCVI